MYDFFELREQLPVQPDTFEILPRDPSETDLSEELISESISMILCSMRGAFFSFFAGGLAAVVVRVLENSGILSVESFACALIFRGFF